MKAFLLAAGYGSRLKPLTDTIPKCLVNIYGKPLLYWWIELFEKHSINEVLINLHYLPEKITSFIESIKSPIKFSYFYENKLLGSAGTLRENKKFVENESEFFICYADNLTNYNLTNFLKFHRQNNSIFSISLFNTNDPKSKGIVKLDGNNLIVDFEEKPKIPKSDLANAGLYLASPQIINLIPEFEITDIGYHLLPALVGKMFGWRSSDFLIDIGTHQDLTKAEIEWKKIKEEKNEF